VYGVYTAFANIDKLENENPLRRGTIAIGSALRELRILFPWKSDKAIMQLVKTLILEAKGAPYLNYTHLLEQDRNGNQSVFCECIRSQHVDEITQLKAILIVRDFFFIYQFPINNFTILFCVERVTGRRDIEWREWNVEFRSDSQGDTKM